MAAKNKSAQSYKAKSQPKNFLNSRVKTFQEKGFAAYQKGNLKEAENYYRKAIELDRRNTDSHNALGIILNAQDKTKGAVSAFKKAIKINPRNASACLNLGATLRKQGALDEAIEWHERAVEYNPESSHTHSYLGKCLSDRGELDKAIVCFQKALTIDPQDQRSLSALGNVFRLQGRWDAACSCFKRLLELQPNDAIAHSNLGVALKNIGEATEAVSHFHRALDIDANNVLAQHELAALTGQTTHAAPSQYVRQLFDQYANTFEKHLVEDLEYHTPQLLLQTLQLVVGKERHFESALDLGCGTGLCGELFRGCAKRMSGIDIAPAMIEKAKEKNVYDLLEAAELVSFMKSVEEKYDLIIAADVFVYIGDLKPVFEAIKQCAAKEAYFIFSVECAETADYLLQYSGRYAHHQNYIQSLADDYGFEIKSNEAVNLRKEKSDWVKGRVYVLSAASKIY